MNVIFFTKVNMHTNEIIIILINSVHYCVHVIRDSCIQNSNRVHIRSFQIYTPLVFGEASIDTSLNAYFILSTNDLKVACCKREMGEKKTT